MSNKRSSLNTAKAHDIYRVGGLKSGHLTLPALLLVGTLNQGQTFGFGVAEKPVNTDVS